MPEELIEYDQILVPVDPTLYPEHGDIPAGYHAYSLMELSRRILRSVANFGLAPLHFITQRGPFQDGETPLDMRLDPRVIQIAIGAPISSRYDLWDKRWDVLDMLRPNRAFGLDGVVRPLMYRKWLPGGKTERGTDMVVTNGSALVTSHDGRFVEYGLRPGEVINVAGHPHYIAAVPNDYTVQLATAYGGLSATNVAWSYQRGWGKRDLYCLLEDGPKGDMGPGPQPFTPHGFLEVLRFIAHDPVWYGLYQQETWDLSSGLPDLTFYLYPTVDTTDGGAWFPRSYLYPGGLYWIYPDMGRWDFTCTEINETTEVVYWGTVGAKPVFTLTGPFTGVVIANDTIGVSMELDYEAELGETVTIDVLNLTVTNDDGDNLLHYLDGDLATWEISPSPQAPNRVNDIRVQLVGGGDAVSAIVMTWRNRYIGI